MFRFLSFSLLWRLKVHFVFSSLNPERTLRARAGHAPADAGRVQRRRVPPEQRDARDGAGGRLPDVRAVVARAAGRGGHHAGVALPLHPRPPEAGDRLRGRRKRRRGKLVLPL